MAAAGRRVDAGPGAAQGGIQAEVQPRPLQVPPLAVRPVRRGRASAGTVRRQPDRAAHAGDSRGPRGSCRLRVPGAVRTVVLVPPEVRVELAPAGDAALGQKRLHATEAADAVSLGEVITSRHRSGIAVVVAARLAADLGVRAKESTPALAALLRRTEEAAGFEACWCTAKGHRVRW